MRCTMLTLRRRGLIWLRGLETLAAGACLACTPGTSDGPTQEFRSVAETAEEESGFGSDDGHDQSHLDLGGPSQFSVVDDVLGEGGPVDLPISFLWIEL